MRNKQKRITILLILFLGSFVLGRSLIGGHSVNENIVTDDKKSPPLNNPVALASPTLNESKLNAETPTEDKQRKETKTEPSRGPSGHVDSVSLQQSDNKSLIITFNSTDNGDFVVNLDGHTGFFEDGIFSFITKNNLSLSFVENVLQTNLQEANELFPEDDAEFKMTRTVTATYTVLKHYLMVIEAQNNGLDVEQVGVGQFPDAPNSITWLRQNKVPI